VGAISIAEDGAGARVLECGGRQHQLGLKKWTYLVKTAEASKLCCVCMIPVRKFRMNEFVAE
jgi:hypothetical protein